MKEYVDRPVTTPDTLVYHPCEPVGAGSGTAGLERGYTKNTTCIGLYKAVVDGILQYNQDIETTNKERENAK